MNQGRIRVAGLSGLTVMLLLLAGRVGAHEWHRHDEPLASPAPAAAKMRLRSLLKSATPQTSARADLLARTFVRFQPSVRFWWNAESFMVGSDGMPAHGMMEGITAWQRQIPVPTYYFGTNQWRLPVEPVEAAHPQPITSQTFLQGAIALAANGIPIFNPANNRGEISALIGELDQWGGHCGRADDYHYHAAPLHLTNVLGSSLPIAFAMDGYPIYGLTEPDGAAPVGLDSFRGHTNALGYYHYHASLSMPFVNGGFHGEVSLMVSTNGQGEVASQAGVQPRVSPVRPSGTPLNGAALKTFSRLGPDQYQLLYSVPATAPATNSRTYSLDRTSGILRVTYLDSAGLRTTNYPNWKPAPALTSLQEPLVVVQPAGVAAGVGESVSFTVVSQGAGTLNHQWLRNGVALEDSVSVSGARSTSLKISPVSSAAAGEYSVRISNAVGTTLSAAAVLTVSGGSGAGTGSVSQGPATRVTGNLLLGGQRVAAVGRITARDGSIWTVPAATTFVDGPKASDLYNDVSGFRPDGIAGVDLNAVPVVTVDPDGEVITGYLFADNYFELYVNGTRVAVDPVPYTPFNSSVVRFRAKRPVTYAVHLVDWEENLGLGTELNGGNPFHPGDGGFMASFSDGTVTGPDWRAQTFYIAPLNDPALVMQRADGTRDSSAVPLDFNAGTNAWALHYPVPTDWPRPAFDDSAWPRASVFSEAEVGVDNKPAYTRFPSVFSQSGARFIWSSNLVLDNEVMVRFTGSAGSSGGGSTNRPPVFPSGAADPQQVRVGGLLRKESGAIDPDGASQTLSYRLGTTLAGASVDPLTGRFDWSPMVAQAGRIHSVEIIVTDSGSPALSVTNWFPITVPTTRPDVVIVVTDDHGFGDLGAHGGLAKTPNMDRLGREGIRLERFYATPVCSVTRSALLTGRNPIRTVVNNSRGLSLQEHTLPETFRAAGYQTFLCGKWHLGGLYNTETNVIISGTSRPVVRENIEYQPQNRGWDLHYGEYTGAINYLTHVSQETGSLDWWQNGQTNLDEGWSTDLLADRAVRCLKERDPLKPLVLYLAFNAVHGPVSAPAEYLARYASIGNTNVNRQKLLAAMEHMDDALGRVLGQIDGGGNNTNTVVVFFGDNGGQQSTGGSNLPLRGDKRDLFDGGIHTPAAIRWPGVLPSGITNCQQFIGVADWFPTLCAATAVTPGNTAPFDGLNLWPQLLRATNGWKASDFRTAPLVAGSSAGSALFGLYPKEGTTTVFKLIRTKLSASAGEGGSQSLFDILNDPLEQTDLIGQAAWAPVVSALTAAHEAIKPESYSPYIGVQPEGLSVSPGAPVTLWAMTTIYAKGARAQWYRNGVALPGVTNLTVVDTSVYLSRLDLPSVAAADAGTYEVEFAATTVGWPAAVRSRSAVLTVAGGGGSINGPPGALVYDVLLGRPTDRSIALNLLSQSNLTATLEYGTDPGTYPLRSEARPVTAGIPAVFTLDGLSPNQRYFYRVQTAANNGNPPQVGPMRTFHTQRARGSRFTFALEADPHHRDNEPAVWKLALTNMLADQPDFLIDLGDTFMEEKIGVTNAYYLTQPGIFELHEEVRRGFFGLVGHSMPTFLVNGNHEAELGWLLRLLAITNNPAVWGTQARQHYFPVPIPGGFYSGASAVDPALRGPRDGYYAFEWGDALFVTLDPFWYTSPKPGQNGWSWTLGTDQYQWLKRTLEGSTARFKFVFAHHLIGGGLGNQARGGLTYAPYFEWGGQNTNGTLGFATERPGWPMPIQQLLLTNGVQAVFHGHDHLYVREELDLQGDGVPELVYQEVPQPSRTLSGTNSAPSYGYTNRNSVVLGNSGHLRVTVSPEGADVEYVRVYLPESEGPGRTNRMVSHRYTIAPRKAPVPMASWRLPDTGQTTKAGLPVAGADSDYTLDPPSYRDNGDGTVTDQVTGWTWQRIDGGEMTWERAKAYAATNTLGGVPAGGWRLPTLHELASLLIYSRQNPALDLAYFASSGGNADYWWSRDTQASDPTRVWVANAGGGTGPKFQSETLSAGGTLRYHARLIRGAVPAPVFSSRFRARDDGIVEDSLTGLLWQQAEAANPMDWGQALQSAEALTLGGFQDWRLPNIRELRSLNDETRNGPSIDSTAFPGAKSARYWTSTLQNNRTTHAWFVEFISGITSQTPRETLLWVRAVRGGFTNTAPVLLPIPDPVLRPGGTFRWTNAATDLETAPTALRFQVEGQTNGLSINPMTGVMVWRAPVSLTPVVQIAGVSVMDTGNPALGATQSVRLSVPALTRPPSLQVSSGDSGSLRLHIDGEAGPGYRLQASTNLNSWSDLGQFLPTAFPWTWNDEGLNASTPWRFFRVLAEPSPTASP